LKTLYVGAKLNLTWLIENLEEGREVKVLVDQYVSPTLNTNLTGVLLEIAERRATGTCTHLGQPE